MRVAIIGSESTGGRLLSRLLSADDTLDIQHWSLPHGPRPDVYWPIGDLAAFEPDVIFVTVRGWEPTVASKVANHQPDRQLAEDEVRLGYEYLFAWLHRNAIHNWRLIVYEFLVTYPEVAMRGCWEMLGRPYLPPRESIRDGNAKWFADEREVIH